MFFMSPMNKKRLFVGKKLIYSFLVFLMSYEILAEPVTNYNPFYLQPACPPQRYCELRYKNKPILYYEGDHHDAIYDVILNARKQKKTMTVDFSKFIRLYYCGHKNCMQRNYVYLIPSIYDINSAFIITKNEVDFLYAVIEKKQLIPKLDLWACLMGKVAYNFLSKNIKIKSFQLKSDVVKYFENLKNNYIEINKTAFDDPEYYVDYLEPRDLIRPYTQIN